ncbi:MAG: hypothetical protein AAGJ38_01105 [Planctomycetota bacterium]
MAENVSIPPAAPPAKDAAARPVKSPKPPPSAVVFHSYPKLLYAWPLIACGLLFYFLEWWFDIAGFLGWTYLFVTLVTLTTLSIDLERNFAFVWTLIFTLLFVGALWLGESSGVPVIGSLVDLFHSLGAKYDPGYGLALSLLLIPPYLVMLIWVRINHRWRITHNEFEHYAWGRADDSLARGAKRVRSTYPDLLELLVCGAGTLIVYSATGRTELRRIPNVPLLFRVRKNINQLLESQQVTLRDARTNEAIAEAEAEMEEEESTGQSFDEGKPGGDQGGETDAGIGGKDPL